MVVRSLLTRGAHCHYRGRRKRTSRANERRSQLPLVRCIHEAGPQTDDPEIPPRCLVGRDNGPISIWEEKSCRIPMVLIPSRMKSRLLSRLLTLALAAGFETSRTVKNPPQKNP